VISPILLAKGGDHGGIKNLFGAKHGSGWYSVSRIGWLALPEPMGGTDDDIETFGWDRGRLFDAGSTRDGPPRRNASPGPERLLRDPGDGQSP
jgi:hypothetical protein